MIHDPALCIAQCTAGVETNAIAPSRRTCHNSVVDPDGRGDSAVVEGTIRRPIAFVCLAPKPAPSHGRASLPRCEAALPGRCAGPFCAPRHRRNNRSRVRFKDAPLLPMGSSPLARQWVAWRKIRTRRGTAPMVPRRRDDTGRTALAPARLSDSPPEIASMSFLARA